MSAKIQMTQVSQSTKSSSTTEGNRSLDPVCGKRVESDPEGISAEYKKRRYYFCSDKCRAQFEHQTEKFRLNELARAGALFSPNQVRWGMA